MTYNLFNNWQEEIDHRTLDLCPMCNRKKQKKNKICASCKEKSGWGKHRTEIEEKQYCQYSGCPTRLKQHKKKRMIRFGEGKNERYYCSSKCLNDCDI